MLVLRARDLHVVTKPFIDRIMASGSISCSSLTCCRNVHQQSRDRRKGLAGCGQHCQHLRGCRAVQQIFCRVFPLHIAVISPGPVLSVVMAVVWRDRPTCTMRLLQGSTEVSVDNCQSRPTVHASSLSAVRRHTRCRPSSHKRHSPASADSLSNRQDKMLWPQHD